MKAAISVLILAPALATSALALDIPFAEAVRKSDAFILTRGGGMGGAGGMGGSIRFGGGMGCAGCGGGAQGGMNGGNAGAGAGGMNGGNGSGGTGGMTGGQGASGGMAGAAPGAGMGGGSFGGLFGFSNPANAAQSRGQDKDKLGHKGKLSPRPSQFPFHGSMTLLRRIFGRLPAR